MSGSGAFGYSQNKNNSQQGSAFSQDVWSPQGDALKNLYGQMGNLFNNLGGQMTGAIGGATDYMNNAANTANTGWNNQMQGGAYSGLGIGNQLMSSLNQSANNPSAMQEVNNMIMGGSGNNYADAMKGQYINDANRATQNMLGNLDARAAASGMSGGSRHGLATAQGMQDINSNLQSQLAQTGYNTFDKDLDRKLQIAGQADSNNLARQQMMSNMLGQQNSTMNSAVDNSANIQNLGLGSMSAYMAPWQMASAYTNTIGAPTVLGSGSSQGNSSGKGMAHSASASGSYGGKS